MSLDRRQRGFAGALAALLVLALLVAGCGGGGDSGSTGAESTAPGATGELGEAGAVGKAEEFGSEASGAEAKGPEAALQGYFDARANGEWSKACSYLAKNVQQVYRQLSKEGCAAFLQKMTGRLSKEERAALAEVEVESVRLEGDGGYVIYTDAEGSQRAKPVEREGGAWKLSSGIVQLFEKAGKKQ
jgi:hypothetical protein